MGKNSHNSHLMLKGEHFKENPSLILSETLIKKKKKPM